MGEQQRRTQHQRTERRTVEHGIATTLQTAKKGQPGRPLDAPSWRYTFPVASPNPGRFRNLCSRTNLR